jgi:hypothetical protein
MLGRAALVAAAFCGALVVLKVVVAVRDSGDPTIPSRAPNDSASRDSLERAAAAPKLPVLPVADSLFGRSRQLRFRTLTRAAAVDLPGFIAQFGEDAIRTAAVHRISIQGSDSTFAYIMMRPFGEKRGEFLGSYRLGRWPSERWMMAKNYWNPDGFIQVTPAEISLPLSPHFTLGDFVTHDQKEIWPKFVVLQEVLIDKLELVLADLAEHGVPAGHVRVLSGFRSPQYNERGVGEGMARASRHQYGDAADIIIDADGDGRMDDLNHDGRIDLADTDVLLRAIERVERRYPELIGGTGLYHAVGPSGPFAHVDVRGTSARWGSGWWKKAAPAPPPPDPVR